MKLYAICGIANNGSGVDICVGAALAHSEAEAIGIALADIKNKHPVADGYHHDAIATVLPDKLIDAAVRARGDAR